MIPVHCESWLENSKETVTGDAVYSSSVTRTEIADGAFLQRKVADHLLLACSGFCDVTVFLLLRLPLRCL